MADQPRLFEITREAVIDHPRARRIKLTDGTPLSTFLHSYVDLEYRGDWKEGEDPGLRFILKPHKSFKVDEAQFAAAIKDPCGLLEHALRQEYEASRTGRVAGEFRALPYVDRSGQPCKGVAFFVPKHRDRGQPPRPQGWVRFNTFHLGTLVARQYTADELRKKGLEITKREVGGHFYQGVNLDSNGSPTGFVVGILPRVEIRRFKGKDETEPTDKAFVVERGWFAFLDTKQANDLFQVLAWAEEQLPTTETAPEPEQAEEAPSAASVEAPLASSASAPPN